MTTEDSVKALLNLPGYKASFTAIPTSLTALALILLGFVVLGRERGSRVNISFFLLTLSVSGWLLFLSLMYCTTTEEGAFRFARLAYLCIPLIPASIYQFTASLVRMKNRWRPILCWLLWLSFAIIIPSTHLVLTGVYRYSWGFYPRLGNWSAVYIVSFALTLAASLRLLVVEYTAAPRGHSRERIREFLIALSVGYLGAIDYLGSYGINLYPVGFLAIAGFLILAARAIWRHHLVDLTPQLAASEILETMPGAVLVTDVLKRIKVANRAAIEMLGYSIDDFQSMGIGDIDVPMKPYDGADTLSRGGSIRNRSMNWRRADGSEVEVAVSASPITDGTGVKVGTVYVGVDVSERRLAARSIASLSRQNQLILQAAGEGICGLDLEGKFTFVNPAAARLTGWKAVDLIGKSHHELIHSRRADGSPYPIAECTILKSLGQNSMTTAEEVFWNAEGLSFPVEFISTPMVEEARVIGAVLTFNDISSRKIAEEQRERILRAEEANRTKDEFLASVSHDLRSPLTAIQGWVQIARKEELKPALQTALEWISYSARMQLNLVGDLIDVSRIVRGNLNLQIDYEDLVLVAGEVIESMRPLAEQKQIEVEFLRPAGEMKVPVDAHRIRQVLWNLMANAIKFTPRKGKVKMALVALPDDMVRISVVDSGCGIEEDFLPFVFDPYRQAQRSGSHEGGLGLGLAIARNLVGLHRGTIEASSGGAGKGSTFTVELPAVKKVEASRGS